MPSLALLKRASLTALEWLWDWYWTQLDAAFGLASSLPTASADQDIGSLDKLHAILKAYVKARKQEIKAKRRLDLCASAANAWASYTSRFSPDGGTTLPSTDTQNALIELLVAEPHASIVPADRKKGSSMAGAFLVWSAFLRLCCVNSPTFFGQLREKVTVEMNSTRSEEHKEALCEWAVHMLIDRDWKEARGSAERSVREKVLGECVTELGPWNLRLAEGIVGALDEGERDMWTAILDASRTESEVGFGGVGSVEKGETVGREGEMEVDVQSEEESDVEALTIAEDGREGAPAAAIVSTEEKIRGPQKVVGLWKPKPIGWLPDDWDEDA
jgi:ribosomal biogenesis protein LAS1